MTKVLNEGFSKTLIVIGKNKASILFIFLVYLLLEFLWALGTVNWGTASRHHLPSLGLLVIASAYSFKSMHKGLFFNQVK